MALRRHWLWLPFTLGLAACTSPGQEPSLNIEIIRAIQGALKMRFEKKEERPPLTRAVLNTLEGSFLEATIESRDQLAYLFVSATLRDELPGDIVVWRTEDNVALVMRNDVLVGTKGLGNDLIASEVQIRDGVWGPAGSGERVAHLAVRDNKEQALGLACEVTDKGPQTVDIVEIRHSTRLIEEYCEGGGGSFTNQYWVDSRAGLIWQSRQWVGPDGGYLFIRRLTTG